MIEQLIYIRLLEEGVNVWRPMRASRLDDSVYLITEPKSPDDGEIWEFQCGQCVVVEERALSGESTLVATAEAPTATKSQGQTPHSKAS